MNSKLVLIINLVTSLVLVIVGILFFAGVLPAPAKDNYTKFLLGSILIGYSVYRFSNFISKYNRIKMEGKREEMKTAQEELIKSNEKKY